ncbi:YdcF family protein [Kozakia baliensis]|uniref:YdcF family protein n=1 Tax=Kozakia baliensis TaxID=153496 RepID=UPI00345C5197
MVVSSRAEADRLSFLVIFGAAPDPDGKVSDAMRRRVASALRFAQGRPDLCMIPSGGIAWRQKRDGPSEAAMMRDLLEEGGFPKGRILLEEAASDTFESACNVTRLLKVRGYRGTLWVASSAYHLPRCLLLLRILGWRVKAVRPILAQRTTLWRRYYWRLREVPAIMWDGFLALKWRILMKN